MIIELNINLNVIGRRNSLNDCNTRAWASMAYLNTHFVNADATRRQAQVEGDDGMLHDQDILLARVHTGNATVEEILRKIAVLSAELEQDCIALRWPDNFEGVLVGPKATTWGDWDESLFQRFDSDVAH